jgi:hypothetical protein
MAMKFDAKLALIYAISTLALILLFLGGTAALTALPFSAAPFIYATITRQSGIENFQSSSSANTSLDQIFHKPGASRPVSIVAVRAGGKASALTNLNGVTLRGGAWTTTASTSVGGTSTTPNPKNNLAPACVATAGMATAVGSTITSGTGGPLYFGMLTFGASGPNNWSSMNIEDVPLLDGNASRSLDIFSSSPLASAAFEAEVDIQEG